MEKRIVVIGSLNYDIFIQQTRLPLRGETYMAQNSSTASGGKGANQAVQCAKLGEQVYLIGCVGDDPLGEFLRQSVLDYGVQSDYIYTVPGSSGMGIVQFLENGEVFSTITRNANFELRLEDIEEAASVLWESQIIILQLEIPVPVVEKIVKMAHKRGIYTILNAAPAAAISQDTLKEVDCLIVNETEAAYYLKMDVGSVEAANNAVRKLAEISTNTVIITLGKYGSIVNSYGEIRYFAPSDNVEAVETTGAGDSFVGAFAVRKLNGDSDFEACQYAKRASEITICGIGAQPSMPNLEQMGGKL